MKSYNLTWTRESYNGTFCALIINAEDEATARAYFTEYKPDAEIVGISEGCDMKPGKPVLTVPEGWDPKQAEEPKAKTVAEYQHEQVAHVTRTGGYDALREADDTYNDLNRAQIEAYRAEHGAAYIGRINFYDDERQQVISGKASPIALYDGGLVYNWGADFCISTHDGELAQLIREWNSPGTSLGAGAWKAISAITNRIEQLGGIQFLWY